MRLLHLLLAATLVFAAQGAWGQSPLEDCAGQFIGGAPANAPTIGGSAADTLWTSIVRKSLSDPDQSPNGGLLWLRIAVAAVNARKGAWVR
jgi:hypothetical protein